MLQALVITIKPKYGFEILSSTKMFLAHDLILEFNFNPYSMRVFSNNIIHMYFFL